jgi:proteasome lid subunit RPN8/RPN11
MMIARTRATTTIHRSLLATSDVEHAWTLVGSTGAAGTCRVRRTRPRSGSPATVTADGAWTLRREETRGDVVGFYHTHPHGPLSPSGRDLRTMRAWCDALGKPLLCVIATPVRVAAWWFTSRRGKGLRCRIRSAGRRSLIVETKGPHARQTASRGALPRR